MHHVQLKRPEELGMVVREMSLCRVEQLFLRIPGELRPALAVSDPPMTILHGGHLAMTTAPIHLGSCPAEDVSVGDPGFHGWNDLSSALSIRFQIVAGRLTT
jgi:hypothetical protein